MSTHVLMRTSLRSKVGNPTTTEVPDATLTRFLNEAQRFIGGRYPFNETRCVKTFDTVAGTARYTVPTNLLSLFRLWDDTNKKKIQKRGVRFLATARKNVPDGKPLYYVRTKDWFQLIPTPDAIYTLNIYYFQDTTDLAADGDVPVLPAGWHDGIVVKARHLYYDERGDIGKAIYAKNEWKDWVSDKPSEIDLEKDDLEDAGVIVAELGGEHNRTFATRPSYRNFPSSFDVEDL